MVGRRSFAFFALVAVSLGAAFAEEDPFARRGSKLEAMVDVVASRVQEVEALLARSKRESTALRTSCIEDKLQQLRAKQTAAANEAKAFPALRGDEAAQIDMLERSGVIEVHSAALVRDARNCSDAQTTQTRLEVKLGGGETTAGAVPGIEPVPPPRYDRPPLASPF